MFEIGASLREARLRRGLSPEDVQKAIRIRDRYLSALEEERWQLLPGDAYAKGFLRTYAEFLGLNGTLYVDEFNSRFAEHEDPAFVAAAMAPVETTRIGLVRPLLAIGAIVAAVAAVAAWQLRGVPSSRPPASPPAAGAPAKHHAAKPAAPPRTTRSTVAPLPTHAVLAATGPVWLLLRAGNSSGPVLYEGTLEQGQTLPVKLAPRVWMRVGAPWNLQIRLGGHVLGGLPAAAANMLLGPHGLSPAG